MEGSLIGWTDDGLVEAAFALKTKDEVQPEDRLVILDDVVSTDLSAENFVL